MFELAYNVNGEPFEVPPTMAAWRVRKLKPKGAPEVVYGRNGRLVPLLMVATVWYVVLTALLSLLQHYVERHFARGSIR